MKLCMLVMLGTLFVLSDGMPPISRDYNTHCRCLQVESRIIPPDNLRSIKLIPEGPHYCFTLGCEPLLCKLEATT